MSYFNDKGASLVEYIILIGVICLISLFGFKIFGGKVWDKSVKQSEVVHTIGN